MGKVYDITDENFEKSVLKSEKVFVLDFFSDWCQPCKTMSPVFEEIAGEMKADADFGKIDISAKPQTPSNRGVLHIPTFIIFKDGQEVRRLSGITPKDKFKTEIEKAL